MSTVSRPRGRPRQFDPDAVLDRITRVFWDKGYECTSLADLTAATGVNAPSLYATFGDKHHLFLQALAYYRRTDGAFTVSALSQEPTAEQAIRRLLGEAAVAWTRRGKPAGCLVLGADTRRTDASPHAAVLRELRRGGRERIRGRIAEDVRAGLLPGATDAAGLAAFYATVLQGMAHQARDGATRGELESVAATAMHAWPAG